MPFTITGRSNCETVQPSAFDVSAFQLRQLSEPFSRLIREVPSNFVYTNRSTSTISVPTSGFDRYETLEMLFLKTLLASPGNQGTILYSYSDLHVRNYFS